MPAASSTLRVNPHPYGVDNTQRRQIVYGTCILSPSGTYSTLGVPLDWRNMQDGNFNNNPKFVPQVGPATTLGAPAWVEFTSIGNETTQPGYVYTYSKPTTGSTTLRISSGGTELTGGASITADNIVFRAEFIRGL